MFPSFPNASGCSRARELVSLGLDDLLDEVQRIELTAHLGQCEDCLKHQEVLERGRAALQNVLAEPSENFEWKVQLGIQRALRERAAAAERPTGSFWRPALASAAAVAALVVGLGSWWLPDGAVQPRSVSAPALGNAVPLGSSLVIDTEAADVVPDLSGAIPGRVFEMDATRDGFGIRTVSRTSIDPRFAGDLYEPMRDVRDRSWLEGAPAPGGTVLFRGHISTPWNPTARTWQIRSDGVQVLNLQLRGSTLPAAREAAGALPESTASVAGPR
jgi:hypothetical protein